jgi:hypothetical protein
MDHPRRPNSIHNLPDHSIGASVFNDPLNMSYEDDTRGSLPPPPPMFPTPSSLSKRKAPMLQSHPRAIQTSGSSSSAGAIPHNLLPSAPASPPTPAPSPTPMGKVPDWSTAAEHEDRNIRNLRAMFKDMTDAEQQRALTELLNVCSIKQLSFVQEYVSPMLKKDPFEFFPDEICLKVSYEPLINWRLLMTYRFLQILMTHNRSHAQHKFREDGGIWFGMTLHGKLCAKSIYIRSPRTACATCLVQGKLLQALHHIIIPSGATFLSQDSTRLQTCEPRA